MRGNPRENQVAAILRAEGWLVGSLRHTRGGGDLIAARAMSGTVIRGRVFEPLTLSEVRLVEVKATAGGPYERFGPGDRRSMLDSAELAGGTAWLAHWPSRGALRWIPASEWPSQ